MSASLTADPSPFHLCACHYHLSLNKSICDNVFFNSHRQSSPMDYLFTDNSILHLKHLKICPILPYLSSIFLWWPNSLPQICLIFLDIFTQLYHFFPLEYSVLAFVLVSSYSFFKDPLENLFHKAFPASTICYNLVNSSSIVHIFITVLKHIFPCLIRLF